MRPFSKKEVPFVTSLKDSPQWICDGSLTATPQQKFSTKGIRRIVQVVDERVLIFDPPEENPIAQYSKTIVAGGRKTKDMRYAFDRVFDENCTQEDVSVGWHIKQLICRYSFTALSLYWTASSMDSMPQYSRTEQRVAVKLIPLGDSACLYFVANVQRNP